MGHLHHKLLHVRFRPQALMDGAELVGDPIAVLPVVFHLLWCGELDADLSVPLHEATLVHTTGRRP
jgi:hypothetical protein